MKAGHLLPAFIISVPAIVALAMFFYEGILAKQNIWYNFKKDLEIHFLELPKIKKLKRRSHDALEEWLMYFNNLEGEEMEEIAMANPGIRKAMTVEQIFFKSQKERRLYELREKAARDEISMVTGAKEEGKAEGKVEMAHDAISKYLEARFSGASLSLQEEVKTINNLVVLDKIISKIYTANSQDSTAEP